MSKTKQKSRAAKNVAVFFVVFIILEALIIFGIAKVFKNDNVTPTFAGYSIYLMSSDAMGSDVPKDALVVAANGAPSVDGVGKAVLAENVSGVGTSVFWLGKVSNGADMNGVVYTLYQQNDPNVTPTAFYEVSSSQVVGTASVYYLTAGKVIKFIISDFGKAVCLVIPLFLLVLIEIIIAIASSARRHEEEDVEEDEDEFEEENVTLDDFLYGGENEKNLQMQHSMKHRQVEEEAETEEEEPAKDTEEELQTSEDTENLQQDNEEAKPAADIDPKYYEEASKLLDDAVTDEKAAEPEVAPKEEKAEKKEEIPEIKFTNTNTSKSASASLEELMKLMEEEQKRLKNQLNNK